MTAIQPSWTVSWKRTSSRATPREEAARISEAIKRELLRLVSSILDILLKVTFLRSIQRDQLDSQPIELAGEPERRLVVGVVHRRAGIHSDIEGLINRLDKGNGVRN